MDDTPEPLIVTNAQDSLAPSPDPVKESNSLESLHLASLLEGIRSRLTDIEGQLPVTSQAKSSQALPLAADIFKTILASWPAFALLLLLTFFAPIRAVLDVLPAKIKNASLVQAGGVSLIDAVENQARLAGSEDLSRTIPALSGVAIQQLLRAPIFSETNQRSLISYTMVPGHQGEVYSLTLPSESIIQGLSELERYKLIVIRYEHGIHFEISSPQQPRELDGSSLRSVLQAYKAKHAGAATANGPDGYSWILGSPVPHSDIPQITWGTTAQGSVAVDIIVKAVASQLANKTNENR
jgi:hypothetical protein